MSLPRLGQKSNGRFSCSNWAETYSCSPKEFHKVNSEDELVSIVKEANASTRKVRVIGAGHSPSDIPLTRDILVSLEKLDKVQREDREKRLITCEAGMRITQLHEALHQRGWAMPNLGSISEQSLAGAMATCTHGSSIYHNVLNQMVRDLTLVKGDGTVVTCSLESDRELFLAASVGLGAVGIVTRMTLQVDDAFDIRSTLEIVTFDQMLSLWKSDQLWNKAEFVRCWWFPYSNRVVVWKGGRVTPMKESERPAPSFFDQAYAFAFFYLYQCFLLIGKFIPVLIAPLENFCFWLQNGFELGQVGSTKQDISWKQLNMNCYFLQYVDEWAVSSDDAPTVLSHLCRWIHHKEKSDIKSPIRDVPSNGIRVHSPIEIRVTRSNKDDPYLSTCQFPITCYIGVIMYKPFNLPIPYRRYFCAFERLMREFGGIPHWAKAHDVTAKEFAETYPKLEKWLQVRKQVDPNNIFTNEYIERHLLRTYPSSSIGFNSNGLGRTYKSRNV